MRNKGAVDVGYGRCPPTGCQQWVSHNAGRQIWNRMAVAFPFLVLVVGLHEFNAIQVHQEIALRYAHTGLGYMEINVLTIKESHNKISRRSQCLCCVCVCGSVWVVSVEGLEWCVWRYWGWLE